MNWLVHALKSLVLFVALVSNGAIAASAADIDDDVDAALNKLYRNAPSARILTESAKGVLVFPRIVKAGLLVGGQYGDGALRKAGNSVAYYKTTAVSYGLQAGAQTFGYALFFMTEEALLQLDKSNGWEIGVGPSVVVVRVTKISDGFSLISDHII